MSLAYRDDELAPARVRAGRQVPEVDLNAAERAVVDLLRALGRDPGTEHLAETPRRVAAAYRELLTPRDFDLTTFPNDAGYDELVLARDIPLTSLCEHHLLPFIGKAHVAYIPSGKVLGLSKVARIVDMYARRLQIQENLSRQIAEAVQQVTGALGVAVVIEAQHMCMMMRGVEKQNSSMVTSVMLGEFRENAATRSEFLSLIRD